MTVFAIILPRDRRVEQFDGADYKDALKAAGLESGRVDFGTAASWPDGSTLSIIVYEWSLMEGEDTDWFGFNGSLYNGNAVLFKANPEGETADLSPALIDHLNEDCPQLLWFANPTEVEAAIEAGRITRPQSSINGVVTWEWRPRGG